MLRDRPVRRAISMIVNFSRKVLRRMKLKSLYVDHSGHPPSQAASRGGSLRSIPHGNYAPTRVGSVWKSTPRSSVSTARCSISGRRLARCVFSERALSPCSKSPKLTRSSKTNCQGAGACALTWGEGLPGGPNSPTLRDCSDDQTLRGEFWCGREDSNFHGSYPTATSTLRVYQFRHDRTVLTW